MAQMSPAEQFKLFFRVAGSHGRKTGTMLVPKCRAIYLKLEMLS